MNNSDLIRYWFEEVWNRKNAGAIRELLADDCRHHGLGGPGGEPVVGPEAFEAFHAGFLSVFPDLHVEVVQAISEGDTVAARFVVTGTQMGDLPDLPATRRRVNFTGGGMCRLENGKFVEVWNEIDFSKMQYDLMS